MTYKVSPIFYAANENFKSTVRFVLELKENIDLDSLRYATEQVQLRYPYFSVRINEGGEEYFLPHNDLPFVITEDGNLKIRKTNGICKGVFRIFDFLD